MEWLILFAWIWAVGKAPGVSDAIRKDKDEDIVDIIYREYLAEQERNSKSNQQKDK